MRILVTGAAGRLGSMVVAAAKGRYETVAFDVITPPAGDQVVTASVTDRDAVFAAAAGCGAIVHPAGLHGGDLATRSSADFLTVNVIGVNHLYEAMVEHGIPRMVLSSTMEVVCGRDWMANGCAVLDEGTQPKPDAIYALSKYLGEQLAPYYYDRHGITTAILRYMSFDARTDVRELGVGLLAHHVMGPDAAEANLCAVAADTVGVDVFHIGPETPLNNQDIVRGRTDQAAVIEKYWPGAVELLQRHNIPIRDVLWPIAPIDKAKRLLKWQPKLTFEYLLQLLREAEA